MVMKNYIEESVKFRMGKWYDKKFKRNEFSWDETNNKNYIYKNNLRWSNFTDQFKNIECNLNPGVILTGIDHFKYDEFLESSNPHRIEYSDGSFDTTWMRFNPQIPVAAHNRNSFSEDSIILPLKPTLRCVFNIQSRDKLYNFDEKKDEIIWRGSFTGRGADGLGIYWHENLKNTFNEFLRFRFVKKWSKKYNIKFIKDYDYNAPDFWAKPFNLIGSLPFHNRKYVDNYFKKNEHMIADRIPFFNWQACHPPEMIDQYKYILSLDGHDWASNIPYILMTESVMISPIPKWHNIFNLDLTPWKHYIPVLDDASDLEEKLTWCRNHQDECKEIIQRANQYISQFSLDTEAEIAKNIIERLYNNSI